MAARSLLTRGLGTDRAAPPKPHPAPRALGAPSGREDQEALPYRSAARSSFRGLDQPLVGRMRAAVNISYVIALFLLVTVGLSSDGPSCSRALLAL